MKEHITNLNFIIHERIINNMDFDILNAFIVGDVNDEKFFGEIKEEVLDFIASVNSENNTVQIYGSDPTYHEFGSRRLLWLLYQYLDGNIWEWELEYIFRAIEFTFEEEDERVDNVVFSFSDPYMNYNINEANIKSAIRYLTGSGEKLILQKNKDEILRVNYQSIYNTKFV